MARIISTLLLIGIVVTPMGCLEFESRTHTLRAGAIPSEAGTVEPQFREFRTGRTASVEAISYDGWQFDRWEGDIDSEQNPLEFSIEEDTRVTAYFVEEQE